MKTFITILFAVLLAGCMSVQKATNYLEKKGELPKICATKYPVQDSKIIIKERITVDTVLGTSYIYVDTSGKPKPCPPSKTITKTIVRDSIIYRRDKAYEQVQSDSIYLLNTINDKQNELIKGQDSTIKLQEKMITEYKKGKREWQWKAWITWIGIVGVIAILIFWRAKK